MIRSAFFMLALFLTACRPTPFKVQTIPAKEPYKVEEPTADDASSRLSPRALENYQKAKQPTFALINGYYRLPSSSPVGHVTFVQEYSYVRDFQAVSVSMKDRDYAIEPISGNDAKAMATAINRVLDAGVKLKQINMSDANTIAKAEQAAAKGSQRFFINQTLLPEVDYLVSVYPATATNGPVLVGRVIKRDGSLIAFRVVDRGSVENNVMTDLLMSLFEDALTRLN